MIQNNVDESLKIYLKKRFDCIFLKLVSVNLSKKNDFKAGKLPQKLELFGAFDGPQTSSRIFLSVYNSKISLYQNLLWKHSSVKFIYCIQCSDWLFLKTKYIILKRRLNNWRKKKMTYYVSATKWLGHIVLPMSVILK